MSKHLGEKIKEARQAAGMSQETCAQQLGVSTSALQKWEQCQRTPRNTTTIKKIANLLHINLKQ